MPKLTVYNIEGKESGSIELPEIFSSNVNIAVLLKAVLMNQANKLKVNAATKTRLEISGGNKSLSAKKVLGVPDKVRPV
ncbi:MAG: 50S ribosomal protein L4, partial [Candidatus Omnitrophota bacterium]